MKESNYNSGKLQCTNEDQNNLLFKMVKWTEDDILHLGTVIEVYSFKGLEYLKVMTIFGKRCRVKMSKVKLISEQVRAYE